MSQSQTQLFMTKNSGVGCNDGDSDSGGKKSSETARDTSGQGQDNGSDIVSKPLLSKCPSNPAFLNLPLEARRPRSQSTDTLSLLSNDDFSELRQARPDSTDDEDIPRAPAPEEPRTPSGVASRIQKSWRRDKGLVWVVCSQAFGVLMNASTRLLESKENGGMHPLQILFARMSITSALSMLYMYYTSTPDFPLGAKGVRLILVARGFGGFFGVFGLYSSLQYLPLSDATVLTFLAPVLSCWVCSKLLHESFNRVEQVGALFSFIGVVLIARPTAIFSSYHAQEAADAQSSANATNIAERATASDSNPISSHRLLGVGMACIGICGATVAYVTIRWIGKRAHPLISVNYFAVACLIVSTISLLFVPSVPFVLPSTLKQWGLLFLIGFGGFVMQFLLTAGLRYEKGSRATNMVYTQMLFALAADKLIWNDTPGTWSLAGSGLILGSALVVAVQKAGFTKTKEAESGTRDEEAASIEGANEGDEEVEAQHPVQKSLDNSSTTAQT